MITTYNQLVLPVLTLFQEVVAPIEEDERALITRRFADGVNSIRDRLLLEGPTAEGEQTVIPQGGV